jgi:hypothetical protein
MRIWRVILVAGRLPSGSSCLSVPGRLIICLAVCRLSVSGWAGAVRRSTWRRNLPQFTLHHTHARSAPTA